MFLSVSCCIQPKVEKSILVSTNGLFLFIYCYFIIFLIKGGEYSFMIDYSKNIARNIQNIRRQKGLTQDMLAESLGVTFQAVSKWENEQNCPDISLLPQIAKVFSVSIDELFGFEVPTIKTFDLPWTDDDTLYGAVFKGHSLIQMKDDVSKFIFQYKGEALNVVSHCSIQCANIQNGAKAGCNINCGGNISEGAKAGSNINCGGSIFGKVKADCNINCEGSISEGAEAGRNINCGGDIIGEVKAGCNIKCEGKNPCDISCK